MKYLSVCSGIEAATAAWHPLGWEPLAFSEIERFPRAVLQYHYPEVPLHGDFTTIGDEYGRPDLLVGGTPCQSFSIAGLRKGMDDERGNLALEYLRLAQRVGAQWLAWENVPGVLSSNGGRDFGSFLGGLVELGYGFAYRVLDAQFYGVAQRRRRVFVVGYLGDWRPPASVLFESESLSWDSPPSREKRETAPTIPSRNTAGGGLGTDFDLDGGLIAFGGNNTSGPINIATAVNAHGGCGRQDFESETFIAIHPHCIGRKPENGPQGKEYLEDGSAYCLDGKQPQCVAFAQNTRDEVRIVGGDGQIAGALAAETGMKQQTYLANEIQVRRLTPKEAERLQGFKDNYTQIPWKKGSKPGYSFESELGKDGKRLREPTTFHCPDGPRYKSLGNSMAVPVMKWIGQRIQAVSDII